ncbi:MAG: hypothetical protein Q4D79_10620 [Propionibacteriaceae bacterium]|nr:hypothetical protein [Propionibacteriaceae bacterium]
MTWLSLTDEGRLAFRLYKRALRALLEFETSDDDRRS